MADTAYERVLCVKNEVLVYKIPPRPSNRGYRADDWKLDSPDWTGRLRVVARDKDLFIKLEDKSGELFAQCPVDTYPGIAIEPVMDSSRYFVIRIKDDSGRSAFIGIGFHDRADSFDLNVSIQDHFKWLKQEEQEAKNAKSLDSGPKLDLSFKEGQTITLNLGTKKGDASSRARAKPGGKVGGMGILPPPPGPGGIRPPPSSSALAQQPSTFQSQPQAAPVAAPAQTNIDLLLDLDCPAPAVSSNTSNALANQNPPDLWGDFTSASGTQGASSEKSGDSWVQF